MAWTNLTNMPFGVVLLVDIGLLVAIPGIILKSFWRGVIVAAGFFLSQVTYHSNPWLELVCEIIGLMVIIYACTYKDKERKK